MGSVWLVRHGRATAGWNVDPDPGLDEFGSEQAACAAEELDRRVPAGAALVSSPMLRCQETAAPLARLRQASVAIEAGVGEIPSPEGVPMADRVDWLRNAMQGEWGSLGSIYAAFRDQVVETVRRLAAAGDTVVFSHFVAINTVIGACLGDDRLVIRSLDNCSITEVAFADDRLVLIEGGHEADTLIR